MVVRPLLQGEEPLLAELEARLLPPGWRPRATQAAVAFYARSGHSFLAEEEGSPRGFVLAQPLWQGDRATVVVTRLLAEDEETALALLRAVEKSAYDAAAYEVALFVEPGGGLEAPAGELGFRPGPRLWTRVLGSRGARGETRGVLE